MTTGERLRSYWADRRLERHELTLLTSRYWQLGLILALMALAAGLRLWDLDLRSIHHDESIHVKFAYDITQGTQYTHDPVYHGPFQYFGTAASFLVFGASDYTSRLFPALFGVALVGLPFLLRRQLGTTGAFIAAGLLVISPTLLYFSRFARNDIYIAFFTLALVIAIWRYLSERRNGWLIAIAPLLALSFAAKEVTFITVAILLVYLNILVANDLVDQLRASRKMSARETLVAYAVILPFAWAIVALWPLLEGSRRRWTLSELPAAGHVLIIFGTLVAAQFAAGIQQLPFVEDQGYMAEGNLMRITVLVLIIGGAYFGLLWNWRVWLIAAGLFYAVYVLLFTGFFTNMGGFWTGIWGSMDYWLSQQLVRRGDQPDYYYFILLPIYEFLPLVFALGGALFYAFRGKLEQQLLAGSALLMVIVFSLTPGDTWLIGQYHIEAAFLVAIGAILVLKMESFTKFLLFWSLTILLSLTIAGEKMPWLTVHLALPIILLAAKVLDDVLSTVGAAATPTVAEEEQQPIDQREEPQEASGLALERLAPLAIGAALAGAAAVIFQAAGPASAISILAWLLSLAALGAVVWAGANVSWRTAGQVAAVGLFAAFLVFTVRASTIASFDQGEPGGTPPELLIYAQGGPQLGTISAEIERLALLSGQGPDLKIIIDNSANIWPWPWYLREYDNVQYTNLADGFVPEPGSVVLITTANQSKIEPYLDQFQPGIPYTHMWWFPERYKGLAPDDFLSDFFQGSFFSTWRGYFIDRTVPGVLTSTDRVAYFPGDFDVDVPVAGPADLLPAESQTVIGATGPEPGQFSQPADMALDAQGNLYVVDTLNQRVTLFAPDGTLVDTFGESGNGPGQFANPKEADSQFAADGPWGIDIDAQGNIYIADTWNHRIQKFSPEGEFLLEFSGGGLFGPRDIAIDSDGNVLVVDTGNKRIVKFSPTGEELEVYGQPGGGPGDFNEPSSISIAPNGDIYVADFWNRRIQHFDAQFGFLDEIEVETWGSQGVTDRAYIVALEDGVVLATDPASSRIVVFDADGEKLAAWRLTVRDSRPIGIIVDGQGQVYISDGLASEVRLLPLAELLPPEAP